MQIWSWSLTVQQASGYKRKQIRKPNADLPSLDLPCSIKETSEFRPKSQEHAETIGKATDRASLDDTFLSLSGHPHCKTSTFPGDGKPCDQSSTPKVNLHYQIQKSTQGVQLSHVLAFSLDVHVLSGKETSQILSQNHLRTYSKGLRLKQSHLSITHPAHKSVPETQYKQAPSVHFWEIILFLYPTVCLIYPQQLRLLPLLK